MNKWYEVSLYTLRNIKKQKQNWFIVKYYVKHYYTVLFIAQVTLLQRLVSIIIYNIGTHNIMMYKLKV